MAKKKGKSKATGSAVHDKASLKPNITSMESPVSSSPVNTPIMIKTCRLCEAVEGPFLNIFGPETNLAKKIDELLPFVIQESDELPHKICFRCSAKIEELYDFVQKCIKSQENFENMYGKRCGYVPKTTKRKVWDQKSMKTNDELCDAVIKRAMEGIQRIQPLPAEKKEEVATDKKKQIRVKDTTELNARPKEAIREEIANDVANKETLSPRPTRATAETLVDHTELPPPTRKSKKRELKVYKNKASAKEETVTKAEEVKTTLDFKIASDDNVVEEKQFDIMDHVTTIKVNGVGILFQCKMCNRNFLKKDVVLSHACAKSGAPKADFVKSLVKVDPPKNPPSNVKYITREIPDNDNSAKNKMKQVTMPGMTAMPGMPGVSMLPGMPAMPMMPGVSMMSGISMMPGMPGMTALPGMTVNPVPSVTPSPDISKPKPGPASRKRVYKTISVDDEDTPLAKGPETSLSSVELAVPVPGLKSHYKLVPGPNNTFTLVEHNEVAQTTATKTKTSVSHPDVHASNVDPQRKNNIFNVAKTVTNMSQNDVIELDDDVDSNENNDLINNDAAVSYQKPGPYPVGLFHTPPVPFTTPAMKKQSYKIVPTGHPSKLLISTSPVGDVVKPPKTSKKSSKKRKPGRPATGATGNPQKTDDLFTFVNVDPLLQPMYVLPTSNIIQEAQITTSSATQRAQSSAPRNAYACNMCPEQFSREKKLFAHIQSHFNKIDELEDASPKNLRKRTRNS